MKGREQGARLPVAVIGAGPVGLAAAAHLAERGLDYVVLESGTEPAAAVRAWGHVRLFSPWRFDVDSAARRLLAASGWSSPDVDALPTGHELIDAYLAPLAKLPEIAPHLKFGHRVTGITRLGIDRVRSVGRENVPFVLRVEGEDGEYRLPASAVIDASGTWSTPNVLGGDGLPALGESGVAEFISTALPDVLGADRTAFAGKRILVVGAGHSAINTLLALAQLAEVEPGASVAWAIRGTVGQRVFGGGDDDQLPARGELGSRLKALVDAGRVELLTGFNIVSVQAADGQVTVRALDGREVTVGRIVAATGFRPDHALASELRLDLDPILGSTAALAPLIDPNEHSCGTVPPHGEAELAHPEPGYYIVGMKSYGRAPTFLMATGYEQVRSVTAFLAGDLAAARDVQLDLPETGVCSANPEDSVGGGGCCGGPVQVSIGLGTGTADLLPANPLPVPVPAADQRESGCC